MWWRGILRGFDSVKEVRVAEICSKLIHSNLYILLLSSRGTKKHFKLDANFPARLVTSGFGVTMNFLLSFLEDYSKCDLSVPTDRAVALSGLVDRISKSTGCRESYGIFGFYIHRNLLWRRSSLDKTERIKYESHKVPSWSWMAYPGGIEFMKSNYSDFQVFKNLWFAKEDKRALITNVWKFGDCYFKEEEEEAEMETKRQILYSRGMEIGWIMYDIKDGKNGKDLRRERSVVVGRTPLRDMSDDLKYHILIVRQRKGARNEYERVGIGEVQQGYVSRQQSDVRIL